MNPMTHETPACAGAFGGFYRAVWRWHFYAGLLVLPFLIWLAVTGGLYLFKSEIDGFLHRELKTVPASSGFASPHGDVVAAALAAHPGRLLKYTPASAATESAEVGIATAHGEQRTVFVDPYRAAVRAACPIAGRWPGPSAGCTA